MYAVCRIKQLTYITDKIFQAIFFQINFLDAGTQGT